MPKQTISRIFYAGEGGDYIDIKLSVPATVSILHSNGLFRPLDTKSGALIWINVDRVDAVVEILP